MRILLLVCFMVMMVSTAINAQQIKLSEDSSRIVDHSGWYLRLPLTTYFEQYNSVNFGAFRRGPGDFSWGIELGYVAGLNRLYSMGFDSGEDNDSRNVTGAKVLFQLRFDLRSEHDPVDLGYYFELEPYVYFVNYDIDLIAGYECEDGTNRCTYYRLFESNTNRWVPGLFFKLGKVFYIGRVSLDVNAGFGLRYAINIDDIPSSPEIDNRYNRNGDELNAEEGISTAGKLGFVFSYRLNK